MATALEPFCTTTEAAAELNCSAKHVIWLIHHKHLDAKRWLRAWMVDRESLRRWKQDERRRRRS